jgi:hypothetical protein
MATSVVEAMSSVISKEKVNDGAAAAAAAATATPSLTAVVTTTSATATIAAAVTGASTAGAAAAETSQDRVDPSSNLATMADSSVVERMSAVPMVLSSARSFVSTKSDPLLLQSGGGGGSGSGSGNVSPDGSDSEEGMVSSSSDSDSTCAETTNNKSPVQRILSVASEETPCVPWTVMGHSPSLSASDHTSSFSDQQQQPLDTEPLSSSRVESLDEEEDVFENDAGLPLSPPVSPPDRRKNATQQQRQVNLVNNDGAAGSGSASGGGGGGEGWSLSGEDLSPGASPILSDGGSSVGDFKHAFGEYVTSGGDLNAFEPKGDRKLDAFEPKGERDRERDNFNAGVAVKAAAVDDDDNSSSGRVALDLNTPFAAAAAAAVEVGEEGEMPLRGAEFDEEGRHSAYLDNNKMQVLSPAKKSFVASKSDPLLLRLCGSDEGSSSTSSSSSSSIGTCGCKPDNGSEDATTAAAAPVGTTTTTTIASNASTRSDFLQETGRWGGDGVSRRLSSGDGDVGFLVDIDHDEAEDGEGGDRSPPHNLASTTLASAPLSTMLSDQQPTTTATTTISQEEGGGRADSSCPESSLPQPQPVPQSHSQSDKTRSDTGGSLGVDVGGSGGGGIKTKVVHQVVTRTTYTKHGQTQVKW